MRQGDGDLVSFDKWQNVFIIINRKIVNRKIVNRKIVNRKIVNRNKEITQGVQKWQMMFM